MPCAPNRIRTGVTGLKSSSHAKIGPHSRTSLPVSEQVVSSLLAIFLQHFLLIEYWTHDTLSRIQIFHGSIRVNHTLTRHWWKNPIKIIWTFRIYSCFPMKSSDNSIAALFLINVAIDRRLEVTWKVQQIGKRGCDNCDRYDKRLHTDLWNKEGVLETVSRSDLRRFTTERGPWQGSRSKS